MAVSIDVKRVITMIVNHHLRSKEFIDSVNHEFTEKEHFITKKGLLFTLDIRADKWNDEEQEYEYYMRRFLVLFCGNVSVFVKEIDPKTMYFEHIGISGDYSDWKNTSNHDSCWRSDGLNFIDNTYFEMCEELFPEKAPIDCNVYAEFGIVDSYPKTVLVKMAPKTDYGYDLINIEEIK